MAAVAAKIAANKQTFWITKLWVYNKVENVQKAGKVRDADD